jgi:kumamolisin
MSESLHKPLKHGVIPHFKLRRHDQPMDAAAPPSKTYTVPELCAAYHWPRNLAGGGVLAIVELNGGWVQSDMDAFFKSIGQPKPSIKDISVDGTKNTPNQHIGDPHGDPDFEVTLDIQVAAASYYVAAGKPAVIRVYWAQDIAKAVEAATADGCDVCSISWGSAEAKWSKDEAHAMEAAAHKATEAGMVVFASSGDNDSSDGGSGAANVNMPSSCPHVIGCGGTRKTDAHETVWNNNPGNADGAGTGGGYSKIFPAQSFQHGAPAPPKAGLGRMVPDVSANADPHTGYDVYLHGKSVSGAGGTSAVVPLYAGLFAAFGKKLGFITPMLWANQHCFNDILHGENGAYKAGPGGDPCSGIGSPIGHKLAALFTR